MSTLKVLLEVTKADLENNKKEKHLLKYTKKLNIPINLINGTNVVFISVPSNPDSQESTIDMMFECIPVYNAQTDEVDFFNTLKTSVGFGETALSIIESLKSVGFEYILNLTDFNLFDKSYKKSDLSPFMGDSEESLGKLMIFDEDEEEND